MRHRGLRLALIIVAPLVCLAVGVLVLRGADAPSLAQGPELSVAGAWPPIPVSVSASPDKHSKVGKIQANANGILIVWSEGDTSPNGEVRYAWNNKSTWTSGRVDRNAGGYKAFSPSAVLVGTTAHFLWVETTGSEYVVLYRSLDLSQGTWQQPYPEQVDISGNELGNARLAVTADGKRHAVWTAKVYIIPEWRDRILYNIREGGSWLAEGSQEQLSGYNLDLSGGADLNTLSQDMPAIVSSGNDVYVAWREKAQGVTRRGLWVRHRDPATLSWEPEGTLTDLVMGYRIQESAIDEYDEFPTLAASGNRLYVMWDRYLETKEDTFGQNAYHVYSMTYRVHVGVLSSASIATSWYPTVTAEPWQMVLGDDSPITAMSAVTMSGDELDPEFLVPLPDDYFSGARPQIMVTEAYTPYVVWHHWANEGHKANEVGSTAPYKVLFSCVIEGDLGTAHWEDPEAVRVMGSEGIFASPAMVLAPDINSPHNLHLALNVRVQEAPTAWDALYTNLGTYYWIQLPVVTRNY